MAPRPLRPKDEPGSADNTDAAADSKGASSKRRAVSSACIPCRKRKSKCDGNVPACSTCVAVYRTDCYYDADSDHRRKGALKRDIQSLQQQNDALDVIVASLRGLPEDEAIALLHSLRSEQDPNILAGSLRNNNNIRFPSSYASQTLEGDFADGPQGQPAPSSQESFPSASSREPVTDNQTAQAPMSYWFRQPQDPEFVDHLLTMYFTWVHPFYHFFSRECFLYDMNGGRTKYCSPVLVNAILALACHYSDRPQARSDPSRATTAGEPFFVEAKRLLDGEDRSCLTTVQALGIMGVRECSQGREGNGYKYAGRCVRMALELGLHLSAVGRGSSPIDAEVQKVTFWGVFNVETLCSVAFGRFSQLPRSAADIQKPNANDPTELQPWRPYEDVSLSVSPSVEQPGRPMLFVEHYSRLSELASDMVNTFYAPQERFTSRRLAAAYSMYQQWYRALPDALRLGNTSLPHVLVLHMYYYACVLHLFRPYVKLDLRGANLFPRDTCTFCANEISALMNALRVMYGLRRVCLAVTSLLLSASTIHLLNLPAEAAAMNLSQSLQDLQAMATTHAFAGRCVEIIRSLAVKWKIALPDSVSNLPILQSLSPNIEAAAPISTFFAASIAPGNASESGTQSSSTGSLESPFVPPTPHQQQRAMQLTFSAYEPGNFADPTQTQNVFWTPFPTQGMPMTQYGPDHERPHDWVHTDVQGRHRSAPGELGDEGGAIQQDMDRWRWE